MTSFRVGAATDVGRVRSNNQDSKLVGTNLYAVADGMGGHQGGEVASAMAVETLRASVQAPTVPGLVDAVRAANQAIFARSAADPDVRGMGTTLCAVALVETDDGGEKVMVINVGDSRVYRFREGDLTQITRDHSLVEDLRAEGRLTAEEAAVHPHRNILTRALGIDADVEVDHDEYQAVTGDRYLLCSDGLFNEVAVERIGSTMRRLADPDDAARELVRLANEHGGRDNITVVIVDIVDGGRNAGRVGADAAVKAEDDMAGFSTAAPAEPAAEPPAHDAPASPSGVGATGEPAAAQAPTESAVRTRRLTWRVVLFVLIVLAVLAAAVGAVGWYARRTYYVGVQHGHVTIFKGQPGGVLWFDPTVAEDPGVSLSDMPVQYRDELNKGHTVSSLSDGRAYIERLQGVAAAQGIGRSTSSPATSSTLTVPPPAPGVP